MEDHIKVEIPRENLRAAEQCLIDNGIDSEEAEIVLQALGYILLDIELYPENTEGRKVNE